MMRLYAVALMLISLSTYASKDSNPNNEQKPEAETKRIELDLHTTEPSSNAAEVDQRRQNPIQKADRLETRDLCLNSSSNEICLVQPEPSISSAATDRLTTKSWLDKTKAINEESTSNKFILFLGDSLTQFWTLNSRGGEFWKENFSERAINAGVGGDRTQNMLWRLNYGNGKNMNAQLIVLMAGINNIRANESDEDIIAGVTTLLIELRKLHPNANILLLAIIPSGQYPDHPYRSKIANINSELSRLANYNKITYLDTGSLFLDDSGEMDDELTDDYIHLTTEGYEVLGDAILPVVENLLSN